MDNRAVQKIKERIIYFLLSFSGLITVITTVGIIWVLIVESTYFFSEISIVDFLTDTEWRPSDSKNPHFLLGLALKNSGKYEHKFECENWSHDGYQYFNGGTDSSDSGNDVFH